jgi:hypothetical protein
MNSSGRDIHPEPIVLSTIFLSHFFFSQLASRPSVPATPDHWQQNRQNVIISTPGCHHPIGEESMRSTCCRIVASLLLCGADVAIAAEPDTVARDAHRTRMKQVAESIQIADAESRTPVPLAAEPLLLYTDATRATFESGLWIFGGGGRPAAIVATEFYPDHPKGPTWLYEIASVSDRRISAKRGTGLDWSARTPGLSLRELPDAGVPAERPARRLSQMKQLLRRFTARESAVIEGEIELRPLSNALYHYEDSNSQLIDGAIFAFANGTNPEVFVLLEAHAANGGPSVWKYALVQMTGGAVSVSLDGTKVWDCEPADPPAARDSYVNGWLAPE